MMFRGVLATLVAAQSAADKLNGSYEGSVPFILDIACDFDGSDKAHVDVNVKVASVRINCEAEDIAETDSQVTFPSTGNDGDCLGDGIRTDGKDPSKYLIEKSADGSLNFKSDGYPDMKLTKKSLTANDKLSGSYEGSVPFILDIACDFDGSDKAHVDVNVKVASVRINCEAEDIAETDSQVTFPSTGNDGDCLGDGIRTDGKDPSKYLIEKSADGSLNFKSDGYPDMKLTKKSLIANDKLSGSYEGSVPFILDIACDFDGSDKAHVDVNVKVASVRINCEAEDIAETDSQVTFPSTGNDGDCLGDGIRTDGKDPSKYLIEKSTDGSLNFKSDGYPDMKLTKKAVMV